MARGQTFLRMVTFLQVIIAMENPRVKANTNGRMEAYITEISKTDSNMAKENGRKERTLKTATCTRVTTKMTRKMALGFLRGNLVITTKAATSKTNDTATARCSGTTAAATRVNGRAESRTEQAKWNFQTAGSKKACSKITHSRDH